MNTRKRQKKKKNTKTQSKKVIAKCQCTLLCKNKPVANSPFCSIHVKQCDIRSPLSGYEPDYDPSKYNKYYGIQEAHNCFAYAFDYYKMPKTKTCTRDSCPVHFPQPGLKSGYPKWSKVKGKRCPDLIARIMGDIPGAKIASFQERCPSGTYKIASVTDEDEDYHFYRQDSNGLWSHKPGATSVINHDALKRPIYNPELASREYPRSELNYDNFCGYMCVPAKGNHSFKRGGKHINLKQRITKKNKKT